MTHRDQTILDHLPQVELLARRLHRRCPQVELDDLISAGAIGLIKAVDRFDPSRNLKLKTFAEHRIQGALLDYLRLVDPLPRSTRQFQKRRDAILASYAEQDHPTQRQLAEMLGISELKFIQMSRALRAAEILHFEDLPDYLRRRVA
ncbi:sigma-70 family RNA polymerase sigma factor [Bryobacter aggregatus]|uniref:sigma-70 family RNA polymerase sigma factor n=1 Tax=Bryobacter aggregatus TaxID=360054 RepID=UPI00068E8309|nr:sigma-70 family RNA polymerase sigma factor [Bryobacter aggregatus]